MNQKILSIYLAIYRFIAHDRIVAKDLDEIIIHSHLVCVFVTSILMWAYTLIAYFCISSKIPFYVGFIASIIHLLSPLLFRLTKNYYLNTNVFIGAGIIHQMTFAFFSGGYHSNIIIWLGILPMLAGVICGKKGVITWYIFSTIGTGIFLAFELLGYRFPILLSWKGHMWAQGVITFGWTLTSSMVIWVFVILIESHEKKLNEKNNSIQNLIYILSHDIATPISVIWGRLQMLRREEMSTKARDGIEKSITSAQCAAEILECVRDIFNTELGKKEIEFETIDLMSIANRLKENFSDQLLRKKLNLEIITSCDSLEIKSNPSILLHQVLGNLMSNAIKFSPENARIALEIYQHKVGKKNHTFIKIKDQGIGIPREMLDHLFEIKAQTHRAGTEGEAGTGFGLPIVKVSVERLGGKISVVSNTINTNSADSGTAFILEFV